MGASIEASAGDDAFHAETKLTVDGGTVNVTSCNEGYEAEKVYVNGGDTHIVASDDGVNASAADLSDDADADTVSSTLPNGGTPGALGKGGGAATPDAGGQAPAGARQGGQAPRFRRPTGWVSPGRRRCPTGWPGPRRRRCAVGWKCARASGGR